MIETETIAEPEIIRRRDSLLRQFLKETGLAQAKRSPLSGDASFRHYERITDNKKTYILMDAPPPKENVRPFIKVARFLKENGFSAPDIIAEDAENGFLLLEDLGDDLYSAVLNNPATKNLEEEIYLSAAELLHHLQKTPAPENFPVYDDKTLLKESQLFINWYLPYAEINLSKKAALEFEGIMMRLFIHLKAEKPVMVLRDYHAENLIHLPERAGHKKVGLLDFQDAVTGSPAYDLVSLLEDARRDVAPALQKKIYDHYLSLKPETDPELFSRCYAVLGAQRNLKIIGIFARLAVRDNKRRYLWFLPRVWKHLENDLKHKELQPLKTWLQENIPADKILK